MLSKVITSSEASETIGFSFLLLPFLCISIITSIFSLSLSRFSFIFSRITRGFFPKTSSLLNQDFPECICFSGIQFSNYKGFIKSYET